METKFPTQDLALPIQIRNAHARLRENKMRLQALVSEQLQRHIGTQTGVFSSVRRIPAQSQEIVEHFLGHVSAEVPPDDSRQQMLEWVRRGLSPDGAFAVVEQLYTAGLEIGARQALRPALDAYRRAFNTEYERARHAETLIQHEQIHRGMYVTLQKQIQKERDARAALVRRQSQLEAAADLARVTTSLHDLNELLVAACRHLYERLNLAFVGVYLLDEFKQWAVLHAGAGEAGAAILAQGYQLSVREPSPLTRAFQENHPIFLKDGTDRSHPYTQPLLPTTPSAIIIPLNVRGTALGFWTAHSELPEAFDEHDATILSVIGDNLAYAIENAELFTRAQASVREMERAQRGYVRDTWANETLNAQVVYSQQQDAFAPSGNGDKVETALPLANVDAPGGALSVPITLRGQVIGTVDLFDVTQTRSWSENEKALASSVVEQMALAVENARLFDQAQQRAQETTIINELAVELSAQLDAARLFETVYRYLPRLMPAEAFIAWLYDAETGLVTRPALYDEGMSYPDEEAPRPPTGKMGRVLSENVPLSENLSVQQWESEKAKTELIIGGSKPSASFLFVPLRVGARTLGVMSAQSYKFNAYNEHHIQVLTSVASHVATALENARLFAEAEQRAYEREQLNEMARALSGELDENRLFEVVYEYLPRLMPTDAFVVWNYEETTHTITRPILYDLGVHYPKDLTPQPPTERLKIVLQTNAPLAVNLSQAEYEKARLETTTIFGSSQPSASLLYAPLRLGDRIRGFISAQSYQFNCYGEPQIALLTSVANHLSSSLENAQLFDETNKRLKEVSILHTSMQTLTREFDTHMILARAAEQFLSALEVDTSTILSYDRAAQELVLLYDHDPHPPLQESAGARYALAENPDFVEFLAQNKPQVFRAADANLTPALRADLERWEWKTLLLVPLFRQGEVSGVIELGDRTRLRDFTADELRLAESLANQASVVIENARLFDQTQQALAETQLLYTTGGQLNQVTSLEELVRIAAQPAFAQGAGSAQLVLIDYQGQEVPTAADVIVSLVSPGVRAPLSQYTHFPLDQFELGKRMLANPHELVMVENIETSPALDEATRAVLLQSDDRAMVFLPLSVEQRVLGAITIGWAETHAFSAQEQRIFQALAAQLALVLNNRLLLEQTQEALQESRTLYQVGAQLNAATDLHQALLAAAVSPIEAGACSVVLLSIETNPHNRPVAGTLVAAWARSDTPVAQLGLRFDFARSLTTAMWIENPHSPGLIGNTQEDPQVDEELRVMFDQTQIRAIAVLPLRVGENWVGLLTFNWAEPRVFGEREERMYRSIMVQAATVMENRRLFEQTEQALAETQTLYEISARLNASNTIQEALEAAAGPAIVQGAFSASLLRVNVDSQGEPTMLEYAASWPRNPELRMPFEPSFPRAFLSGERPWSRNPNEPLLVENIELDSGGSMTAEQWDEHQEIKATALLPLKLGARWIGLLNFNWKEPRSFTVRDVRLFRSIMAQAATVLDNRALFEQTQVALEQTQVALNQVQEAQDRLNLQYQTANILARAASFDEMVGQLLENTCRSLNWQFSAYWTIDESGNQMVLSHLWNENEPALHEFAAEVSGLKFGPGQGIAGRTWVERRPLWIPNLQEDPNFAFKHQAQHAGLVSGMAFPLQSETRQYGVVVFFSAFPQTMDDTLMPTLGGVGSQIGQYLERRRAEEAVRQQNTYLTALHDTTLGLMRRLDLEELLQNIITRAAELVGTQHGYVHLVEPNGQELRMRVGVGIYQEFVGTRVKPGQGLAGAIWRNNEPIVVDDYRYYPGRLPNVDRDVLRAVAGVPLRSGDQTVGVLGLASLEDGRRFGSAQIEALNRFAELAAVALDNAQLYNTSQEALTQTQRMAQREKASAEIADKLYAAPDVKAVLRTAAEELRRSTGSRRAIVRLNLGGGGERTNGGLDAAPDSKANGS